MRFPHKRRYTLLFVITIIPAVLLASFFLFLGVVTLISPDVPERALAENTLVGADLRICFRQPALLHRCRLLVCAGILALNPNVFAGDTPPLPAFPGAEGFGANATGGRGGRVIAITSLNDEGPGSLRAALEQEGPRTVVFRVSGTIALKSALKLRHGDITIAGQTAPGNGICLQNYHTDLSGSRNVIIRHLRFRPGDASGQGVDALTGVNCEDIIIDHCSFSWSVDECLSLYRGVRNLTVQWCLVSESLYASVHIKGNHGFGGIWGGTNASWHHNLLAHHSSRNPRFASDCVNVDFRNNVIYNWGYNSAYGGERSFINVVNNYYKPGPATEEKCDRRILDVSSGGRWYVSGNYVVGFPEISANNWNGGVQRLRVSEDQLRADLPFPFAPVTTHSAEEAYKLVLKNAGATLPRLDSVDARVVEEVRGGTARFGETYGGGGKGIINSPETVGGWPKLRSAAAPLDTDGDGMPDEWERRFGLDPNDPSDGPQDKDGDGYTNLEEYLNGTDPTEFVDYNVRR